MQKFYSNMELEFICKTSKVLTKITNAKGDPKQVLANFPEFYNSAIDVTKLDWDSKDETLKNQPSASPTEGMPLNIIRKS